MSDNVAEVLWSAAGVTPSDICLTDLDAVPRRLDLTFEELRERVSGLAGGLAHRGVEPGDRVAILLRNSAEFVEVLFAVAAVGAVAVPLNVRLGVAEHAHMLEDSGAKLLFADSDGAPGGRIVVRVDRGELDELRGEGQPLGSPVACGGEHLLSLMYTSGTTGLPKAVMLSHGSWREVARAAVDVLALGEGEVFLHAAPLTHGAGFLLLPVMLLGGRSVVSRSFHPAEARECLAEEGITGMFLVPTMIRMLLDSAPEGWVAPSCFRRLYYAGSPIDPDTLRDACRAFDGGLVQSFGQMESPMFFTVLTAQDHLAIVDGSSTILLGAAGRVLPGVDLTIEDPVSGTAQPVGVDGEIVVRAPQTMLGYWNRPEESAATLKAGRLHTGDIGHVDEAGYLYVVDRLKDMIVTGGSNVYAREVELVLDALPEVRESAVIGLPDRIWGEAVTAVLVAENEPVEEDAIREACRSQVPDYRVPKRVIWVDQLPRNSYGKVLKKNLRDQFSAPG